MLCVVEMIAKTMWRRQMYNGNTGARNIARAATKLLAKNIAPIDAPPTAELIARHVSRMSMKQNEI